MPRLPVVPPEQIEGFDEMFGPMLANYGYAPNTELIVSHIPDIMRAYAGISNALLRTDRTLPRTLKWMVAHVASRTAGCNYCAIHTIQNATTAPGSTFDDAKVAAIWDYENSPLFTEAEKAALHVARGAAMQPNCVTDEDFDRLKQYFTTAEIVEIVAVISLFGWLNRLNDTLHTELEASPLNFAKKHDLEKLGLDLAKHAPRAATNSR